MGILKFNEVFEKHEHKFSKIVLSSGDIHNCVSYINNLIKHDLGVIELGKNNDRYKGIFSLVCQITAISNRIEYPIIDFNDLDTPIIDQFRRYAGKWVDIIVFNDGEFPIFYYPIYKKSIFICKISDTEYTICGYGSKSVINSYSHKSLVQNQNIRENTSMIAFYGFEYLKPVPSNIYDFQNLVE
jgi:hypothetical protein